MDHRISLLGAQEPPCIFRPAMHESSLVSLLKPSLCYKAVKGGGGHRGEPAARSGGERAVQFPWSSRVARNKKPLFSRSLTPVSQPLYD